MTNCKVRVLLARGELVVIMVMCALTDRRHARITMNQADSWSETIDSSYRGKGELSSQPWVTPLPDHGDTARRLMRIRLLKEFKHRISK